MGYVLFPLLVFAILSGIFAVERTQTTIVLPSQTISRASADGRLFVAYRDAVTVYLQNHPAYIGNVPDAALVAQGNVFPADFLAVAGNTITQVGSGSGRIITCYANLSPGSVTAALKATDNDASFGISSAGTWKSYAQGVSTTSQSLASPVPDGDVVSVIQFGG